jgi:hypothetical protein
MTLPYESDTLTTESSRHLLFTDDTYYNNIYTYIMFQVEK